MVTKQQVLRACDAIAANSDDSFSIHAVIEELTLNGDTAGTHISAREVRRVLHDLPNEVGYRRVGRTTWYERYSSELREAWRQAQEVASQIGGTAELYTTAERPALISLSVDRARELAIMQVKP